MSEFSQKLLGVYGVSGEGARIPTHVEFQRKNGQAEQLNQVASETGVVNLLFLEQIFYKGDKFQAHKLQNFKESMSDVWSRYPFEEEQKLINDLLQVSWFNKDGKIRLSDLRKSLKKNGH